VGLEVVGQLGQNVNGTITNAPFLSDLQGAMDGSLVQGNAAFGAGINAVGVGFDVIVNGARRAKFLLSTVGLGIGGVGAGGAGYVIAGPIWINN